MNAVTLIPRDAPALLATFASASECMARLERTIPVEVVEIVEDPPSFYRGPRDHASNPNRERDAAIVREWLAGKTAALVAAELGLTCAAVAWVLRRDIHPAVRVRIGAEHRADSARRRITAWNARSCTNQDAE